MARGPMQLHWLKAGPVHIVDLKYSLLIQIVEQNMILKKFMRNSSQTCHFVRFLVLCFKSCHLSLLGFQLFQIVKRVSDKTMCISLVKIFAENNRVFLHLMLLM